MSNVDQLASANPCNADPSLTPVLWKKIQDTSVIWTIIVAWLTCAFIPWFS